MDKGFADCSIPQEMSNAEINAELQISDASCGEDGSDARLNSNRLESKHSAGIYFLASCSFLIPSTSSWYFDCLLDQYAFFFVCMSDTILYVLQLTHGPLGCLSSQICFYVVPVKDRPLMRSMPDKVYISDFRLIIMLKFVFCYPP